MTLYCATTNPGKLREFRLAGERAGVGVEPIAGLAAIAPAEETGATFEENAKEKAAYYSRYAPGPVFADDSGLCVDALGGDPGVLSARWASEAGSYHEAMRRLDERLRRKGCLTPEARRAHFVSALAIAWPDGEVATPGSLHSVACKVDENGLWLPALFSACTRKYWVPCW